MPVDGGDVHVPALAACERSVSYASLLGCGGCCWATCVQMHKN